MITVSSDYYLLSLVSFVASFILNHLKTFISRYIATTSSLCKNLKCSSHLYHNLQSFPNCITLWLNNIFKIARQKLHTSQQLVFVENSGLSRYLVCKVK